jgi:hypothetical protein
MRGPVAQRVPDRVHFHRASKRERVSLRRMRRPMRRGSGILCLLTSVLWYCLPLLRERRHELSREPARHGV